MSHHCSGAQTVRPEEKEVLGTEGEGGDHEGEHDGEDEEQQGERKTMKVLDPVEPTEQEVSEHFLTHLQFRNWCRHCARGREVEMPHKKGTGERTLLEVHFDFCFMGDEAEGKDGTKVEETMPVLVVREVKSKMTLSTAVLSKSTGTFVARRVVAFLREIGCLQCHVVAKSDQEPAITSIVLEVGRIRAASGGGWNIVESSPVGSSGSNGVVERAIRSVEQQVRVMKDALEHRTGMQLTPEAPVDDVDHRVCWSLAQPLRGRLRRQDGVREV